MQEPQFASRRESRLGALAVKRGLISSQELETILEKLAGGEQGRGIRTLLGEHLVRERYITGALLSELLEEQRRARLDAIERRRQPEAKPFRESPAGAELADYLSRLRTRRGQELLFLEGKAPALRTSERLTPFAEPPLAGPKLAGLVAEAFSSEERERAQKGDPATKVIDTRAGRFRATLSACEGGTSMSFRPLGIDPSGDPSIPQEVSALAERKRGLVVVAGGSAAHRATVLAKLIEAVNAQSRRHVIALDRHMRYEHANRLSLIAQREVGTHTKSYEAALRAALREDPDVLAIGEIREPDAIATALLSAETGHLVLCSIHASDATQALRRLVDVQGTSQRALVRATLANVLQAVVVVDAVLLRSGDRRLVAEVLPGTPAVTRIIREDRLHHLAAVAATQEGYVAREAKLEELYRTREITRIAALECGCPLGGTA